MPLQGPAVPISLAEGKGWRGRWWWWGRVGTVSRLPVLDFDRPQWRSTDPPRRARETTASALARVPDAPGPAYGPRHAVVSLRPQRPLRRRTRRCKHNPGRALRSLCRRRSGHLQLRNSPVTFNPSYLSLDGRGSGTTHLLCVEHRGPFWTRHSFVQVVY